MTTANSSEKECIEHDCEQLQNISSELIHWKSENKIPIENQVRQI